MPAVPDIQTAGIIIQRPTADVVIIPLLYPFMPGCTVCGTMKTPGVNSQTSIDLVTNEDHMRIDGEEFALLLITISKRKGMITFK